MKGISILIKPASGYCNLACKYCFYNDVTENRNVKNYGMMEQQTSENLIKKALGMDVSIVTFAFQGGEPTLRGLDFYRSFVELVGQYNVKKIKVHYAMQTNGMLIDNEWARFFSEHNYLLGISLDGSKDVHDLHRVDAQGNGSYNRVLNAIQLLDKYHVEYNILTVVTKKIAKHIIKIYGQFKKHGFKYLQFIPCLDKLGTDPGLNQYSLTPDDYVLFLNTLFDAWYQDILVGNQISIRMFDNIVSMLMGYPSESCDMQQGCSVNLVIEADGSTYPCDFYVLDDCKLGQINNDCIEDMLTGNKAKTFVEKSLKNLGSCRQCSYFRICKGGCERYGRINDDVNQGHYFCSSYKAFYEHSLNGFKEIAQRIRNTMRT